jgi:putative transposase
MPRKARITALGVIHHVMARGIEGRNIFNDGEDRNTFLSLLSNCLQRNKFKCYAWVLMDTHYHLLVRTSDQPLSRFMRRLNSIYARYISKKYCRRGYLFQDRYKSIASQDQHYVEALVRYIHLNPVRAGICKTLNDLDEYVWSGHSALVGNKNNEFQDTVAVLRRFGKEKKDAIARYRKFISDGFSLKEEDDLTAIIRKSNSGSVDRHQAGCWVIGDQAFVQKVISADKDRRIQLQEYRRKGWTIDELVKKVGERMRIPEKEIMRRGRNSAGSDARKSIAYLGYRVLEIPIAEIARYFHVSGPAVSMVLEKGEQLAMKYGLNKLTS